MGKGNKTFVAQKVPVNVLLELLTMAYNNGAEFVDIEISKGDQQDSVNIVAYDEYMRTDSPESITDFENLI